MKKSIIRLALVLAALILVGLTLHLAANGFDLASALKTLHGRG